MHLKECFNVSKRRACAVAGQHRTTQKYPPCVRFEEGALVAAMKKLVKENLRRGCRHITMLLQRDGWQVIYKRVHRLWKELELQVPRKHRRKRPIGTDANACKLRSAKSPNDVWTWDFIHDRSTDGRALKFLAILDEYTRECLTLEVGRSLKSSDVLDALSQLIGERGAPRHIRSDNGSEFIAKDIQRWLADLEIDTLYIEPGAPSLHSATPPGPKQGAVPTANRKPKNSHKNWAKIRGLDRGARRRACRRKAAFPEFEGNCWGGF